jgi:hypothetical protein
MQKGVRPEGADFVFCAILGLKPQAESLSPFGTALRAPLRPFAVSPFRPPAVSQFTITFPFAPAH